MDRKHLIALKHKDGDPTAVFSPNGDRILTASEDRTAKVWDFRGNLLAIKEHNGMVSSAVSSPRGQRVFTA